MKIKYSKRRYSKRRYRNKTLRKRKRNSLHNKFLLKNNKTRKILRGGVLMPFSETSGIFGHISNSVSNLINTVVLPATPTYNPLLPIDSRISSQYVNNNPTQSLSEILK